MILFTLECAEMPLSREQIATVMSENGVENYFDVCEHIIDLEANGCIASVPTFKMQMIVMTPRGEEIMNLFGKTFRNPCVSRLRDLSAATKMSFVGRIPRALSPPRCRTAVSMQLLHSLKTGMRYLKSASSSRMQSIRVLRRKIGRLRIKNIYRYAACACEDVSECAKLGCSRNLHTEQYIVLGGSFVFSRNGL